MSDWLPQPEHIVAVEREHVRGNLLRKRADGALHGEDVCDDLATGNVALQVTDLALGRRHGCFICEMSERYEYIL